MAPGFLSERIRVGDLAFGVRYKLLAFVSMFAYNDSRLVNLNMMEGIIP